MSRREPLPETTSNLPRGRLALLFFVSLVMAAGNTAQQSVMPAIGTALGIDDVWISLAFTWSATLWVFTAPVWARRSDRRGRKAMMKLGVWGFCGSFFFGTIALWLGLSGAITSTLALVGFALARGFYGGFGSAAPPAAQAYVASRTPPEDRTRVLALMASAFGLGTVIGPALVPFMVVPGMGLASSLAVFALLGFATLGLLQWRLPDDTPAFAARGSAIAEPGHVVPAQDLTALDGPDENPRLSWGDRRVRPWVFAGLFAVNAHAAITGLIGFLVLDRLGLRATPEAGTGPIGMVMMSGALATLLAQWGLIPTLRLDSRASCSWGMAAAMAGTAMLAFASDSHAIVIGFALYSLGMGLFRPGYTAGMSMAVSREEQGVVAGLVTSVNGSAFVLGPVGGVWLYTYAPPVVFAAIATSCFAALVTVLLLRKDDV